MGKKLSKGVQLMVASIVSFSLMHLCVKTIPEIPVHQIISFRSVFSLLLCIYVLKRYSIPFWGNNKLLLFLRGLAGACSLICFFYSIKNLPLATAVTISNLIPFFTLTLAALVLKEKIQTKQWLFFLLSFIGVLLIKGFDNRIDSLYLFVALGAAFFTACAHFLVRKLRETENSHVIIFYFPLVTLPLVGPYTFTHWVAPSFFEWIILGLIGLFTHIGQLFLTKAYATEEVSSVSNIYFIGILLSLGYGYFLFDESFPLLSFIGMGLIIVGVLLTIYTKKNP